MFAHKFYVILYNFIAVHTLHFTRLHLSCQHTRLHDPAPSIPMLHPALSCPFLPFLPSSVPSAISVSA